MLFGKYVNKYYLKYAHFFILGILALLFVNYFQLEIPKIIGSIINGLENKNLTQPMLKDFIGRFFIIAIIMFTGRFLWRVCILGNGVRIECDLRNEMFYSMQKLSQRYFQENKTGALMAFYTNDLTVVRRTFGMGTIMLIDAISLGALALYYMFKINVVLSIVSLSALLIVMVVGSIIGKKITKATDANFKAYGRMSDYVQEDFSGISVIKAFVKERLQMKRFQKYNQDNRDTTLNITKIAIKMEIIISVVLTLINLAIISYGAYLIWQKSLGNIDTNMDIGTLTEFLAYFDSLIWPIMAIGRLIDLRSQGQASLNRISSVMNEEVEINDLLVDTTISTDEPIKGLIEYKNLEFSYPNSEIKVLTNVNFKVEAGEFVGIMGGTGVGKTTIVDLLLRIYNIEEGMLYIDGNDIMHLPIKYVRDNISYVPQDNFLFSKTIEDNISFSSDLNGEKKNVVDYAKLSDVDKDIVDFKEGYETILGERGVTVSGGQKQRISMARALYKDSSILVLDDSLSAVDTETEKKIINNLRALRKGKTTIIIAHRISTLQYLDKIVVVEDGTVTGVGTHDELVLINEHYANEVHLQELEKEMNAKEGGNDE